MSTWYPIVLKNWNIRNPSSPIVFRASSSGCSTYRIGCPSFFDSAAGRSPKANSSPASSTVLPIAAFGSSKARATNSPMSFTATSCWRVAGRSRDDEESVHVPKERGEARALCEVTLNAFDSRGGESVQLRGVSREPDHSMSSLEEAACDRPSLLSRRPRHQNRLRLGHVRLPRGP